MNKFFKKENKAIIGLSLGHFSVDLYAALLIPLYPLIVSKLGINLAIISSIIAFGHLISSMLQPIFGFVSDRLKHRFFMVWGLILSSIFIPFAIKSPNLKIFIFCLALGMVGNAFFHPQVTALIKDFNKNNPNLSFIMGIFLGLGTIGYAFGPYLSSFIVNHFGENSLLYTSLVGLISAFFMYFFVPKKPKEKNIVKENFFFIMKEILKNKTCVFLTFISIIKSATCVSFSTYIPFLLKDYGFSLPSVGLIVTLYSLSGGLATIVSSRFEDKIGLRGVIVLSFVSVLPLVLLFLYLLKINKYVAIIPFLLAGFTILLCVGIIIVHAQNTIPKYTGVISGVMQGFSWGIGALFLAPFGILAQNFGVESILLLVGIITFLIGLYTIRAKEI